jgi:hypothetical protein
MSAAIWVQRDGGWLRLVDGRAVAAICENAAFGGASVTIRLGALFEHSDGHASVDAAKEHVDRTLAARTPETP